ncbi:MAG: hypothetical protein HUU57_15065 [Bdellovibrio sp.]|nr:hypothetical protein [Bdellovibrio sp.]
MKSLLVLILLSTPTAFAAEFSLSKACEAKLEQQALSLETTRLADLREVVAGKLEADVTYSYSPIKSKVSLTVSVEDKVDGRHASYRVSVLKTEAENCEVTLTEASLSTQFLCRYSSYEGPEGLLNIPGVTYQDGPSLTPESILTNLQKDQVLSFLGSYGESDPGKAIEQTDDSEVLTAFIGLPDGRLVMYMGAYGGDTAFGVFFYHGTTGVAGDNSDGSVCIGYK